MTARLLTAATAALLGAAALPALAQGTSNLRIGVSSEPTSLDPHFHNVGPNNALRRHLYEGLVATDQDQGLVPALATSWRAVDDLTWEFKLRSGVKFSDGTPFTARDVVYTICRVPKVENSPSSFTAFVRPITAVETPDPMTIRLKTATPTPLMPINLAAVGIISAKASGAADDLAFDPAGCKGLGTLPKSADFSDPKAAPGTGPFMLEATTRGTSTVLARNPSYWGAKPAWDKVTFRPLTSAGPRVAALLAGDVDVVEVPPIQDIERIRKAGFEVVEKLSNRVIYIALDQNAEAGWKTPGISGTGDKNPFLDPRVREAFSKAIDRKAIAARIMGGSAVPAGELLPYPLFGTTKDFPVVAYDQAAAKKLLTEAGYPDGFELTLGTPNDRYINDEKIAQAVAQMLARVGIKTNVDAMTASTFFTKRNAFAFSAYLAGWGADSGELSNSLNSLVVSFDPKAGQGQTNRARTSNKELDGLVVKAMATVDDAARAKLLQQASKIMADTYAIVPLHFEVTPWALRKGLTYKARVDQYTLAGDIEPTR